jgi:hypothetical protein
MRSSFCGLWTQKNERVGLGGPGDREPARVPSPAGPPGPNRRSPCGLRVDPDPAAQAAKQAAPRASVAGCAGTGPTTRHGSRRAPARVSLFGGRSSRLPAGQAPTLAVGEARNRVERAVERTVPFGLLCQALTRSRYGHNGDPTSDTRAPRRDTPPVPPQTRPLARRPTRRPGAASPAERNFAHNSAATRSRAKSTSAAQRSSPGLAATLANRLAADPGGPPPRRARSPYPAQKRPAAPHGRRRVDAGWRVSEAHGATRLEAVALDDAVHHVLGDR